MIEPMKPPAGGSVEAIRYLIEAVRRELDCADAVAGAQLLGTDADYAEIELSALEVERDGWKNGLFKMTHAAHELERENADLRALLEVKYEFIVDGRAYSWPWPFITGAQVIGSIPGFNQAFGLFAAADGEWLEQDAKVWDESAFSLTSDEPRLFYTAPPATGGNTGTDFHKRSMAMRIKELEAALYAEKRHVAALRTRLEEAERRLDFVLADAMLAMVEDGDRVGLFLTHAENEKALAIVAWPSGEEDGELTIEDAPFLTDDQRADLNGTVRTASGCVTDPVALRAAIDVAIQSTPSKEQDHE